MDNNPHEGGSDNFHKHAATDWWLVVTLLLVNADEASAEDFHAEFEASQITSYAYTPPSATTAIKKWPTLETLIADSTRLVTFVASLDSSTNTVAPYLLDEFAFVFENPFEVLSLSGFSCIPDRPSAVKGNAQLAVQSGRVPLMNHFLDTKQAFGIEVPDISNITTTNAPTGPVGNLGDAASECTKLYGKAPTFILVDFFDQGSTLSIVDSLNGIITPVGRTTLPATPLQSTSGTRGNRKLLGNPFTTWRGCLSLLVIAGTPFALL